MRPLPRSHMYRYKYSPVMVQGLSPRELSQSGVQESVQDYFLQQAVSFLLHYLEPWMSVLRSHEPTSGVIFPSSCRRPSLKAEETCQRNDETNSKKSFILHTSSRRLSNGSRCAPAFSSVSYCSWLCSFFSSWTTASKFFPLLSTSTFQHIIPVSL